MSKGIAFLKLMRPANIVTSVADILAGIAISGFFTQHVLQSSDFKQVILLCISTIGLYGGGIVFNDVFDAKLDKIERPERPIPSGIISTKEAAVQGTMLLLIGVACATLVNITSGLLAVLIAAFALIYDKWGKHHKLLGPVNMGICRGINLLLGISIIVGSLYTSWPVFLVPILYIASITMISRGEVHGGNKNTLYFAASLYLLVIAVILFFSFSKNNLVPTCILLINFSIIIFNPLFKAIREPIGKNIGKAVKAGVIALILMDAAWAAAFGAIYVSIFIILLLPISIWLAKIFAVT